MPVAKIDPKLCNGCGRCVDTCPEDVFRLNLQPIAEELKSPCAMGCPAGVNVRKYSYYIEMDMMDEAIAGLRKYNPFPAITGRICPHPCENKCARNEVDGAVNINCLERFIADRYLHEHASPVRRIYAARVAVIGSGPAGMSCAYYLCEKGYSVTVFEKEARPGGMPGVALPTFRLEQDVVDEQIRFLTEMGVEFRCGVEIGKDLTIAQLREQGYESIYLAIGLHSGGKLRIPGDTATGVRPGVDFMKDIRMRDAAIEGDVVVIGGGMIGADVARSAKRRGAKSVHLFCLENYDAMPMGVGDRTECENEGVVIHAGWGQTEILESGGHCVGIRFRKCLQVTNAAGRFDPVFDDAITEEVACDQVLYCIGQKPAWGSLLDGTSVALTERGFVVADKLTYQTGEPYIFAGGDVYTGQKFVVDAIGAGRKAAESIDRYLRGVDLKEGRRNDVRVVYPPKDNIPLLPRQTPACPSCGFSENEARVEAQRCMTCGSRSEIVYPDDCMVCLYCMRDCPMGAITITPDRISHKIEPWDLG